MVPGKKFDRPALSFILESPFRILQGFLIVGEIIIVMWTMADDILICLNSLDEDILCLRQVKLCYIDIPEVGLNSEVKRVVSGACV